MPDFRQLENPNTNLASQIISSDNKVLGKIHFGENRTPIEYNELPNELVDALISTEDERFYSHSGIDFKATLRAIIFLNKRGGASTISQQLARQLFVGVRSKNIFEAITQKVKEWVLAVRLEKQYTKQEIITDIRAKVSDYLLNITRRDKLPKSDIIYILEEIEGVDAVNVRFISETEETARRLGYFESKTISVVPQEPVILEEIGNGKQKYIFFKQVEEVQTVKVDDTTQIPYTVAGLDEWGDIIMEKEEVAVFRGGWQDRDGDDIVDEALINAEAALSVNFDETPVPRTIYTRVQAGNRKALK